MAERFLKLNLDTDAADFLARHHPYAFVLLSVIAMRARRIHGQSDGLIIGDAIIGSADIPGMSRQNFRTALEKLVELGHVKIVSNGKSFFEREKSTIKITIKSNLVNLIKSTIYDINSESTNHQNNQQLTNSQPTANHKQERRRKKKNEKEDHPSIPSFENLTDDFSSEKEKVEVIPGIFLSQEELESCVKIKGNLEKVQEAMKYIQGHKKRKSTITDWPNAMAQWKIEDKAKKNIEENIALAERLCKQFHDYKQGNGWRCYMYTDTMKDQKGILFECSSAYQEAIFIPLVDGEFEQKCRKTISENIVGELQHGK